MKSLHYLIIAFLGSLIACTTDTQKTTEPQLPDLVMQIKKQARLYTTECHVHKIISHNDSRQLDATILGQEFSIPLPLGKRSVAIPIEATVKSYIDFADFSSDNVNRNGDKIEIILPDPKIELTSTHINHDEVRQYVPLLRANFTDQELTQLENDGREAIVKDLPQLDITEQARQNAARTLIPMLAQMGFPTDNITITFRKQFTPGELRGFISTQLKE